MLLKKIEPADKTTNDTFKQALVESWTEALKLHNVIYAGQLGKQPVICMTYGQRYGPSKLPITPWKSPIL